LRLPGWYAPRCIDELATILEANPEALVLAGGTDIGLWVTKQLRELPTIVYIGEVRAIQASASRRRRSWSSVQPSALTDAWAAIVRIGRN
jgi:xanthine dehydrogenase small subunit